MFGQVVADGVESLLTLALTTDVHPVVTCAVVRGIVHAACPHDCPDTCAMLVTVEDGRAVKVAGDPDHPVTAGTLCAKVSDYVERVYAPDRLARPLVRDGPKGSGKFRETTWDAAIQLVTSRLAAARDEFGGEAILPYSYLGTMGYLQRDLMSARVMNAIGATDLERTICADAGIAGVVTTHGLSPEVDPERWVECPLRDRVGVEPALDGTPTCGASSSKPASRAAPSWSSSTRSGVAPHVSPTSTCDRCPAPTVRWRWA